MKRVVYSAIYHPILYAASVINMHEISIEIEIILLCGKSCHSNSQLCIGLSPDQLGVYFVIMIRWHYIILLITKLMANGQKKY